MNGCETRVPCGVGAGFWTARCSASKFDDAASDSARGRDLMMRTAGARIMSISGARRAQTSQGCGLLGGQDGRDYCPVHELTLPAPGAALKYPKDLTGMYVYGCFKHICSCLRLNFYSPNLLPKITLQNLLPKFTRM